MGGNGGPSLCPYLYQWRNGGHSVGVIASKPGLENMAELRALWLLAHLPWIALTHPVPDSTGPLQTHPVQPLRSPTCREAVCWQVGAAGEDSGWPAQWPFFCSHQSQKWPFLRSSPNHCRRADVPILWGFSFRYTGVASTLSLDLAFPRGISRIRHSPSITRKETPHIRCCLWYIIQSPDNVGCEYCFISLCWFPEYYGQRLP